MQADGFGEQPFEGVPEMRAVEQGIHEVGDGAVVDVLRVRVMDGVVVRSLEDADILQERDEASVLVARAVRPFVDLISVGADDGEQPDVPRQRAKRPRGEHDGGGDERHKSHELCSQFLRVMWRGR